MTRLETAGTFAIVTLIATLMGGAAMAWALEGSTIWAELRLAELAGCFGF